VIQRRTPDATHQVFREQDQVFLLSVFLKEKSHLKNDQEALKAVNRGILSLCNNLGYYYSHSGRKWRAFVTYVKGFTETGETKMVLRAASTCFPSSFVQLMKSALAR
jgi:hypothetical protein